MTYPDHTVYPFATTNSQDFKNLMSVYLDATLHPLLRPNDFAQEGWRIGPENPTIVSTEPTQTAVDSQLVFKGVVYNEMKGAMSNADTLFTTRWQDHIFPALNNSAGDPMEMTNLTHEQLKNYHAEHYHPSNAKIFTYGNLELSEHLREIGPRLNRFNKITTEDCLKMPVNLDEGPKTVTTRGPSDPIYPKDQQYKASVSWLMCDTSDVLETFALGIISSLLLEGFGAPLYQNTIEVGWGASYTANTGFDSSGKIGIFSIGLNGLRKHDAARLNFGLHNTLESVKRTRFEVDKVKGRLHQIELGLKHKTAYFGMGLMSRLQDGWFNGIDPFITVDPKQTLDAFKAKLEEPRYLENLFERYWLKKETFTFIMEPTSDFEAELLIEEASRLKTKISETMKNYTNSKDAREALKQQEMELLKAQEAGKSEDMSCLPTVHVNDIPRRIERKHVRHSLLNDTKIQWRETPTNGLTYFRAVHTLHDLPDELRIYLPLFSSAIQRLGTKSMPIAKLENLIKLWTGGINVGHYSSTSPLDLHFCAEGISFAGHALDRNVPHMYDLLRLIIFETDFDKQDAQEKISELIKGSASNAINDIAEGGSGYAQHFAEAGLSQQGRLNEEVVGLTQVRLMMDLAARSQKDGLGDVIEKLKTIQSFVLAGGSSLRVALTCGSGSSSVNENALQDFLSRCQTSISPPSQSAQIPYPRNAKSFFPLPYQVYYSALAISTVPYIHPASASLKVLAELLTHKHLHHEIREKGGAYGAAAYSSSLRGIFGFSSYRDPNPVNSLKIMNEAGVWARDRQWTDRDLEEAKLSVFQSLDAPRSVSSEGMTRFLTGVDEEMEQTMRERLLDVDAKDVNEVAQKYIVEGMSNSNVAVLGKKQDWVAAGDGWTEMPMSSEELVEHNDNGYLVI